MHTSVLHGQIAGGGGATTKPDHPKIPKILQAIDDIIIYPPLFWVSRDHHI